MNSRFFEFFGMWIDLFHVVAIDRDRRNLKLIRVWVRGSDIAFRLMCCDDAEAKRVNEEILKQWNEVVTK